MTILEMYPEGDQAFLRSRSRPPSPTGAPLRIVDLFSGCGGMSLGAVQAALRIGRPVEIVLAMELNERIRAVYDANFVTTITTTRANVKDRFDGRLGKAQTLAERGTAKACGEIDILLGGPPCQGHSALNNHTRRNDPKNALYLRMLRAVEVISPRCVIIENVPDVRHATNHAVRQATNRLSALGYEVLETIVSAARVGVPQQRMRHVLLAARTASPLTDALLRVHETNETRDLRWAIGDLEHVVEEGLFRAARLSKENERRAQYLLRHERYDLPNSLRPECHRAKPKHRYKSMYGRLAWDQPAQTITTGFGSPGQGRYLHPSRPRTLTPHEAARIQFFPDWFDFSKAEYRTVLAECLGNAVPPKLAFTLTSVLLAVLGERAVDEKHAVRAAV